MGNVRVALVAVASVTTSLADASPVSPAPKVAANDPTTVVRYGRTIVLVDAIGASVVTASLVYSVREESDARYWGVLPFLLGSGLYLGLAAAVHKAHGNEAAATTAFVLRCTFPMIGFFAGGRLMDCSGPEMGCRRGWIGAAVGASAGAIAATAIDAKFLAHVEVPAPYIAPVSGGATVGIGGTF